MMELALFDLPGRFPDKQWFVIVDDESFVFKSNLARFLPQRDSSLPQWIVGAVSEMSTSQLTAEQLRYKL
jgi:hypothetical protein